MKLYRNDEILNILKNVFKNKTIMFAYFSGSIAYGTQDENSDIDVNVILLDLKGSIHLNADNLDIFAYGFDRYIERQKLNENIPHFYRMHIDDVITIDNNLIYLDERFRNEFNICKDVSLEINLKSYLNSFVTYHHARLKESDTPGKWQYHIFRLRGILDHFDKTGKYEMIIEEPWRSYLFDYKKNYKQSTGLKYQKLIKEQLDYITNYKDRL